MATITKDIPVAAAPAKVWAALADFGAVHEKVAPGFVVSTELVEGARIVTFGNGMTARERFVSADDAGRRLVYSIEGGRLTHHNASVQVLDAPGGTARVIWTADILPDTLAETISGMMGDGAAVMQTALAE